MPEFDLISRLQEIICIAPDAGVAGCRVGIGDDAAVLDVSGPHELVVCVDTLVAGVHFLKIRLPPQSGTRPWP
jgi:thiamine monophosphate kinase